MFRIKIVYLIRPANGPPPEQKQMTSPKSLLRVLLTLFLFGTFVFQLYTGTALAQSKSGANGASSGKFQYPVARKSDQIDDYHGTAVADPYRWLEDADSAETRAWVQAENKITFSYLDQIPFRQSIKDRMTRLWNYERYTVPFKEGGRYFYSRNNGLQNQNILYTTTSLTGEPKILLDPNTLSADGTVALSGVGISKDGKLLAYGLAASGSDWQEWKVRDIESGKDLPDDLKWVKFSSASFDKDSKGFFYNRYDQPNEATKLQGANYFQKLCYHRIGTSQSDDILVYDRPDAKEMLFGGSVTDDGHYLIISGRTGAKKENTVYYKDLTQGNPKDAPLIKLLDDFDAIYNFVDNDGPIFFIHTNLGAPNYKIIAIDTRNPQRANWKTVIPEAAETISDISAINDKFVASYLKDAHTQVKIYDLNGKFLRELALPGIGTAAGFNGKRRDDETFYSFTSFINPLTVYHYNVKTGESTIFRKPKVDFDSDAYETKQVFYHSKDGTRVPMFITAKKGTKLDGNNPTYLFAYGGFDISLTPEFRVANAVWLEMGGIYAQPNLRGGGEYGEKWHEAGTKLQKQNVFDDFIAAAVYLIKNKYTSTPKLAVGGRSNGGLLIGAVETQRPELFGATLPGVGVMDMLRFHKFTIGWAWVSDYGSSDDPEQFKAIYKYSPLHNIKPGTKYPPTFIVTADHDDRVVPAHSFKFATTMQADQAGPAPILIRIETKAGHGGGKPITKQIEELTDEWSFLAKELHMDVRLKTENSQSARK